MEQGGKGCERRKFHNESNLHDVFRVDQGQFLPCLLTRHSFDFNIRFN